MKGTLDIVGVVMLVVGFVTLILSCAFSPKSRGERLAKLIGVILLIGAVVVFVLGGGPAHAANPADLTSDTRYCPVRYYKAVYDDGPWYLLAIEPLSDSASLSLFEWHNKDDTVRQREVVLSKQLSKGLVTLETALIADFWKENGRESTTQSLMLDLSNKSFGAGVIFPFQDEEKPQLGLRLPLGDFTAYLTATSGTPPLYGISYKKGITIDLAYGSNTWFFRVSKPIGKVIPEIRTKFTEQESFIGLGIAFCLP